MTPPELTFRRATPDDLDIINRVIESAILNWPMAKPAKHQAVRVNRYSAADLDDLEVFVCTRRDEIIGVATLDADYEGKSGLLHGLYVLPLVQGQGIGKALMQNVFDAAAEHRQTGVLVKAQRVSAGYFEHCELERLESDANDYPHRYYKALPDAA